jgi:hypothetical protein
MLSGSRHKERLIRGMVGKYCRYKSLLNRCAKILRLVLLDGGSMYECLASWLYFIFLEFTIKVALDGRCASLCMHA